MVKKLHCDHAGLAHNGKMSRTPKNGKKKRKRWKLVPNRQWGRNGRKILKNGNRANLPCRQYRHSFPISDGGNFSPLSHSSHFGTWSVFHCVPARHDRKNCAWKSLGLTAQQLCTGGVSHYMQQLWKNFECCYIRMI